MQGYQHYSFDLWLTLIRSNPAFKQERARYFFSHYNTRDKSLEEIQQAFRQVDLMCNAINEKTGGNIDAEEMYLMVISAINDHRLSFHDIDIDRIYTDMEELVFRHLPEVYGSDTHRVLNQLRSKEAVTLNILSNTGFIKGSTLRKILAMIELESYFDFQLYSDELGWSKPCRQLFEKLLQTIGETRRDGLHPERIIHVGDNPLADIRGAAAVGISSLLINSNHLSISNLVAT